MLQFRCMYETSKGEKINSSEGQKNYELHEEEMHATMKANQVRIVTN